MIFVDKFDYAVVLEERFMTDPSLILMLVLMFAMLYFFMIRPENKRRPKICGTP